MVATLVATSLVMLTTHLFVYDHQEVSVSTLHRGRREKAMQWLHSSSGETDAVEVQSVTWG